MKTRVRDGGRGTMGNVTVERIMIYVAQAEGLTVQELKSCTHARKVAWPRQMAMALCRELTDCSLPGIGQRFGGMHHTTVLHAVRRVEKRRASSALYDERYTAAKMALRNIAPLAAIWLAARAFFEQHRVPRRETNPAAVAAATPSQAQSGPRYLGSDLAPPSSARLMGARASASVRYEARAEGAVK